MVVRSRKTGGDFPGDPEFVLDDKGIVFFFLFYIFISTTMWLNSIIHSAACFPGPNGPRRTGKRMERRKKSGWLHDYILTLVGTSSKAISNIPDGLPNDQSTTIWLGRQGQLMRRLPKSSFSVAYYSKIG
jgi:hypothetical protein